MTIKKSTSLLVVSGLLMMLNGCNDSSVSHETVSQKEATTVVTATPKEVVEKKEVIKKEEVVKKETLKEVSPTPKDEIAILASSDILTQATNGGVEETMSDLSILDSGDSTKGQKLYSNKLKKSCGLNGSEFAHKHTQEEWGQLQNSGKLAEEIASICKGATIRKKYLLDISAFVIEFASDSGNVPTGCS